jgi:glutamine amidotransferase
MIAIVDYGLGNIRAFANVYKRLGMEHVIATEASHLAGADKVILPGVGAFDEAMSLLGKSGMREPLDELVLGKRVPVLGICVGMQILSQGSDEGRSPGLGWIEGRVRMFDVSGLPHKTGLPHMGWNTVSSLREHPLLRELPPDPRFYFLHSYYFECAKPNDAVAQAVYGSPFACVVSSGNVHGVQFHPEKSHANGVGLLRNFGEM